MTRPAILGNPMIFREMPLEAAVRAAAAAGFDALELWPPQIAACRTDGLRRELAAFCAELGAPAVRLNAAGAAYFDAPLSSPAAFHAVLPALQADIRAARALGMRHLITWEGRRPAGLPSDALNGGYLQAAIAFFRAAADYGRDHGVALTVEMHPFTLGADVDWLLRLFDGVGAEDFGLTYDCAHFGVARPNGYVADIARLGARIHHVHFSDSDQATPELHLVPGRGQLRLLAVVAALHAIQYAGTWMLDLWGWPFPKQGARQGLDFMRQALNGAV